MMTASTSALLQATNLTQKFTDTTAVDAISLTVHRGEVLGLLGLNGAGKSSTLRMLAGVLAPSDGEIHIDGKSMSDHPLVVKQQIGYLPEVAPLYTEMRVRNFLVYAARLRRVPAEKIKPAVERLLAELNLEAHAKRTIGNLSKGFKQRVGLAQALVHDPILVILDEPSSGLDPEQMREMRDLIKKLSPDRGIIFSSHLLSEVNEVCNRVAVLHEGRLVHTSSVTDPTDLASGSTMRHAVRFKSPVDSGAVNAINCVCTARRIKDNLWSIETASGQQDTLLFSLLDASMSVIEFGPERPSLEALFSSLVTTGTRA